MKKAIKQSKQIVSLRKKAEKKISTEEKSITSNKLEHELHVHKIELELQNEELLLAQSKLIQSIDEYSTLFNNAPIGYFILDSNGVIKNVNEKGCQQLGYLKNKIIGKAFSLFLHNREHQDNFYRHRNEVLKTKKEMHLESAIKRKGGNAFFAIIESSLVLDENNNFKHFLSTLTDISERKLHEQVLELSFLKEKELNELKNQFITIASHEFRTPLATILMSAELMEKYNKPEDLEKKSKHYQKISVAVSRIREILLDFLSVDDAEKGVTKNNPINFNIVEFIQQLITETRSFDGTHVLNYTHIGKNVLVTLDKKLLKTCISNLIINAYKYSPLANRIDIISEQKKKGSLTISVTDYGIGIPKSDQTHIFEKFYRAKNTDNIQGTGLGLNITKKMVKLMNGTISFNTSEKNGTTFVMHFPNAIN